MQKLLQFAQNNTIEVTKETLSGFLLDMKAIKSDDSIADIQDLNKIGIDIILERENQEPKYIWQGYMHDLLVGLYSQSTKYSINLKKLTTGYKLMIDLTPSVIELQGEDKLIVKLKAENIAFTALDNGKSSIEFETIPAFGNQTVVPVIRQFPIGNGEVNIDRNLGNDIVKITLLTDLTTDYFASVKAKPVSVDIFAHGYEKSVSENLIVAENIHYLDGNPESLVEDLVLYTGNRLDSVRLKSKLNAPADAEAKIMTVSLEHI